MRSLVMITSLHKTMELFITKNYYYYYWYYYYYYYYHHIVIIVIRRILSLLFYLKIWWLLLLLLLLLLIKFQVKITLFMNLIFKKIKKHILFWSLKKLIKNDRKVKHLNVLLMFPTNFHEINIHATTTSTTTKTTTATWTNKQVFHLFNHKQWIINKSCYSWSSILKELNGSTSNIIYADESHDNDNTNNIIYADESYDNDNTSNIIYADDALIIRNLFIKNWVNKLSTDIS